METEDFLAHHGVLGMHWGKRKVKTASEIKQRKVANAVGGSIAAAPFVAIGTGILATKSGRAALASDFNQMNTKIRNQVKLHLEDQFAKKKNPASYHKLVVDAEGRSSGSVSPAKVKAAKDFFAKQGKGKVNVEDTLSLTKKYLRTVNVGGVWKVVKIAESV